MANLVKEPTCYQKPAWTSSIDLIITNKRIYLMNTKTAEISISDFHKLILTVIKSQYTKLKPKVICYRNLKNFDSNKFIYDLKFSLKNDTADKFWL